MKPIKGKVISKKMEKTATVLVERKKIHRLYRKGVTVNKKYHAHNGIDAKVGDKVKMIETRPISKTKRWKIIEVIK